jgi:hypothetical protein
VGIEGKGHGEASVLKMTFSIIVYCNSVPCLRSGVPLPIEKDDLRGITCCIA